MTWSSCQHILMEDWRMKRVAAKFVICRDMQEELKDDPQFLTKVVIGVESLRYGYYPESEQQSSQWKSSQAWQVHSTFKTMLISFFDIDGIVHREFVFPGHAVNQKFYLNVLKRLCESL